MWRCGLSSSHDALGQRDSDRCWPGCRVKESSSLTLGVLSRWGGECPTIWGLDTHTYTRTPAERASGLWGSVILTLCGVPAAVNAKTSRTQTHLTLNGSIIITSWRNSLSLSLRRPLYWPHCYFLLRTTIQAHCYYPGTQKSCTRRLSILGGLFWNKVETVLFWLKMVYLFWLMNFHIFKIFIDIFQLILIFNIISDLFKLAKNIFQ